jgi:putative membrane protein
MANKYSPNLFYRFALRWFVCSLGLWIAAGLLGGDRITYDDRIGVVVIGGLLLAVINAIIKPVVVILSLPAILFTLGLFMVVINGLMVMLAAAIYSPLDVSSIWSAMLAGVVIGLVNYLVSAILEERS